MRDQCGYVNDHGLWGCQQGREEEKDREKYSGTESESDSGSILRLIFGSDSNIFPSNSPSKSSSSSPSYFPMTHRERGRQIGGHRTEKRGVVRRF